MSYIVERLRDKHLKITPQRIAIYQILSFTASHPSAETIYKSLEPKHPSMSLATVYKTLDALIEAGLIQELYTGDNHVRYDANPEKHPHFVCTNCRNVYDLKFKRNQNLADAVDLPWGFKIENEKIFYYGLCPDCNFEDKLFF